MSMLLRMDGTEQWIARTLAEAPPLTDEQVARIARLLVVTDDDD